MHGHQQYRTEEFADGTEHQLTKGIATGWLVYESKEAITLAMDYFDVQPRSGQPNDWRLLASYPKSGIQRILRRKVRLRG